MTAFIIILSILLFLVLLLLLPVSLYIGFDGDFIAKIKILGIKIYELKPQDSKKKSEKSDKKNRDETVDHQDNFFEKLKKKHGFSGALKEILAFIKALLSRLKKQMRHIAVRRLCLDIRVASPDAAQTAIEYGAVCSAVYPILSLIDSTANVKMKQINVYADFNSDKPVFGFSVIIRAKIIFLIIMAFTAFSEYNNFKTRNEL